MAVRLYSFERVWRDVRRWTTRSSPAPNIDEDEFIVTVAEKALALPADDRDDYIRSCCGGDSKLADQIRNYAEWETAMGRFLLDPVFPSAPVERPFEPGELVAGRFQIIREIGVGGMGIVYEARDKKLKQSVAIKCARRGFDQRLPPEVSNARYISHPNVCRVFDIYTASRGKGEIDFFTMEFLDGETLADRLARSPKAEALPKAEARLIAQQICAGMAEAHRIGVVHGDLKTNNVILANRVKGATGEGPRAVITDFGLAHQAARQNTEDLPADGVLASDYLSGPRGVPDYMAPELWKGDKISPASDVYALGIILYELAAGRRPFGSDAPVEERTTDKVPRVRTKWGRARLDPIIARCLDPEPLLRFRDAGQVREALNPPVKQRRTLKLAAAAALALAVGIGTYMWPKQFVTLEMLPVKASPETASTANTLSIDASSLLSKVKGANGTWLSFVGRQKTEHDRVDSIDKARATHGATHVLNTKLTKADGNFVMDVEVTNAKSGANIGERMFVYEPGRERFMADALAGFATETLHLRPLPVRHVNAAARRDYEEGVADLRKDSTVDAAIPILERARDEDPDSPLTWAALADAYWQKYFAPKDRSWLEKCMKSQREAEIRNPDVFQVRVVSGLLEYDAGRYERAEPNFLRAAELDPKSSAPHKALAMTYEHSNQIDRAEQEYWQALQIEPKYYRNEQQLGQFYNSQSDYEKAAEHFAKAVKLEPLESDPYFVLGSAHLNSGDFDLAETELLQALAIRPGSAKYLDTLGAILIYKKQESVAVDYIKQALEKSRPRFLEWFHLGIAYARLGRLADSELAFKSGLKVAETEKHMNPQDGSIRAYVAYFRARLNDTERAEDELDQALSLSPYDGEVKFAGALTYDALHERDRTLSVLRTAAPDVLADIARWPDTEHLLNDSDFQRLLEFKQVKLRR